jgi:beta-phosphoglucomutase-like phosphatase (HAD superfamily)
MAGEALGVLLDLDETLVLTEALEQLRTMRAWPQVYAKFPLTSLPEGTAAFVVALRQFGPAGIVTTTPRRYAEGLVRYHRIDLPVLVAYHDTSRHKPFPDPLVEAARRIGVAPARCVHVGDAMADDEAARAAGMTSLLVAWHRSLPGACNSWHDVLARLRALA